MALDVRDAFDHCDIEGVVNDLIKASLQLQVRSFANHFESLSIPLAKIIPVIYSSKIEYQSKTFISQICLHPTVQEFSANIFEAFCEPKD